MAVGNSIPPIGGLTTVGDVWWLAEHSYARAVPVGGARAAGNGRGNAGHGCGRDQLDVEQPLAVKGGGTVI